MSKFKKMEEKLGQMKSGVKPEKKVAKTEKPKKMDADLNKDGKVDEKDLELVEEAVKSTKKDKKIVKKK